MTDLIATSEQGFPGHFCAAERCVYHRCTVVHCGEKHIIVSSVGQMMVHGKMEQIGYLRWYETMCFWADPAPMKCGCWAADVTREVGFEAPSGVYGENPPRECPRYDPIHEGVVREIRERIEELEYPVQEEDCDNG